MPVNAVAENVLGTFGTVFWTIQVLPQIWKSFKTKSTEGLSPSLVLMWALSAAPLGTYVIVQNLNIPLILQPQLFGILCVISWGQTMYYGPSKKSKKVVILTCLATLLGLGLFELIMVIALRTGYGVPPFTSEPLGKEKPGVLFFGVLSATTISVALIPQYREIYLRREVIGISKMFMLVDMLGVFSDLSLAFKEDFDISAGVTYSMVVLGDGIVLILAFILNPLARRRRARETSAAEELPGHEGSATPTLRPTSTPQETVEKDEPSHGTDLEVQRVQ